MENATPTGLPETLAISTDAGVISEEVATQESVAEVIGVARCLPSPLSEGCGFSAEAQRLPAPLCPLASDAQIDNTVQELQYGLQTDDEKSHSNSQTNQAQPSTDGAGPVAITGTQEKQAVNLEYKSDTETDSELGGKKHTGGNILTQSQSQLCFTASSPCPQSSVDVTTTEHGTSEQSDREPPAPQNPGCTFPSGAEEQTVGLQDSESSPHPLPSSESRGGEENNLSTPNPQIVNEIANYEKQRANTTESAEMPKQVNEIVDPSDKATRPTSAEILETPKDGESLPGLCVSPESSICCSTMDAETCNIQGTCKPSDEEQLAISVSEEQMAASACEPAPSSPKASAAHPLFNTGIVVSLQTEQVVEGETSLPSNQVSLTDTPLIAELVRSADAQEIVVVREGPHIGGDWTNLHLKQSYLVQREDGSVCEAAIVNELTSAHSSGGTKLYGESVQAAMELDAQPMEVYEFCSLVEEVAEETVCASGSVQIPHSPGYEVNLFNALLENSEEYTVKEELETHLDPTIHTINESDTLIISQQPLPSSHAATQIEANDISSNLSIPNAVGQHLVLDANTNEVCLVEVAADSFTVTQTDTRTQIVTTCAQVGAAASDRPEVDDSPVTVQMNQQAEATAGLLTLISPVESGDGTRLASPVTVSVHSSRIENQTPGVTVVSAIKPGACVSSQEGTKETPAPSETPSQTVAVTAGTKPGALITASGIINPKLLLLQPAETPLLKPPPTVLAQVSQQPNVAGTVANTHSSASKECLGQTVGARDSLCASVALGSQKSQTQGALSKASSTALPFKVQQADMGGNITLKLYQSEPVTPTNLASNEALIVTTTSTCDAIPQGGGPLAGTPTLNMLTVPAESTVTSSASPNDPSDSPYVDEDGEEMEHDETQEATSGQVSSPEEGSDEEPDADKMESEMSTPSSPHKVRQWIAGRGTLNSAPVSPAASSYPGRSASSDWTTPRRERASPLRGPHGKFVSPSAVVGYTSSSSSPPEQSTSHRPRGERHTDMAELAKHEADIEHRTQALKREGFWSTKRLTRLTEPQRPKVHWDYLCEEMQWLSADFAQERRWKRGVARKVVRMVMRHHEELRQKEEKAKRDEHAKIRRVASSIAKEVRAFWSSVEKVVQYKQQSRLEEKRKKALDLQLDFIVGQTEKYSDLLSKSLAPARPPEPAPPPPKTSAPNPGDEDDRDFEPTNEEEDDEETIEVEEQQEGNDAESHRREIELLKEEGMLPLDQLLSTLKMPQDSGSDEESSDETSSSAEEEEDGEFTANEEDAEDEEDTIAAQEKVEGNIDHAEELDDLAKEGDMSIEALLEKYKGAYAPDFDAPSASGSKESSDSEVSGEEEVETEEDESDVESNTSSSDSAGDSGEDDDDSEKEEEEEEEESEGEENNDKCADEGTEVLLKEGDSSPPSASGSRPKKEISHIAATAESLQPKGYTLATTKVKTPIPFLLHGTLREYQHIGLDWLVTMFEKKLNGILADEMGLGKTIQTIALLAHLACEKGNWGPHLIIVPTSVMLNWEMELKRWCPGFKILTYFGSQKERKLKRQGWTKPNAFHVCITSYKLVLQDHQAFRRKSWRYLILDEAQNIKNFKSQRWQSLLKFNSHRRLLLTGTPLQNSLMELWSLMHFLMPHVFQSHREFKEWFSNPLTGMIEGSQEYNEGLVKRLHKVLRPFLLRRIKIDVEKQMPKKYEHVVRCRLSKRQRFLYDDFMSQASTRETLASGHFMSVINILMQLRKVCNHPNLFDPRPIQSPFITQPIVFNTASLVQDALEVSPLKRCDLSMFNLVSLEGQVSRYEADIFLPQHKVGRQLIQEIMQSPEPPPRPKPVRMKVNRMFQPPPKTDNRPVLLMNKPTCSVPPAAQTAKPAAVEVAPPPAPVVQQVVCSVGATPPPRASVHPATQTAVRSSTPKPVLTVRPPAAPGTASIPAHPTPNTGSVMPQRVLLSPDMQARLPSGEVVSIAQLASLAGRPVSSCQGSKPVTFQLQGNKLTLSGAQIHQVPAAPPRPVQGNVMHLVSSGVQHLITQPAQVTVQTTANTHIANPVAPAVPANRLSSQVPSSVVSSAGVVKIVVRQSAGKEGGPVPTLAVAPSPRIAPQASPSLHPHTNTTPIRATATLQISQRTPGPATAHYTIAPPRTPSTTLNQQQSPRPILKVVQPPAAIAEQPAPALLTSSLVTKSTPCESSSISSSSQTSVTAKSRPSIGSKPQPPPRRVPRPPPRSPFHMQWIADSHKQQCDSRMDFIARVNEHHCSLKPVYGSEILKFLTFLSGPRPSPATVSSHGEWPRSGHSSCLLSQWQHKDDYWLQSRSVREAIHSIEERLELLADIVDRFTFAIPPVEAPAISMHCCHPPPSLSHKQKVFSSMLTAQVASPSRSLHRIQCNMRTQFPDLRLIQYDCGKLQTLHTLLRKLKTGGHRVLIFTQMTRMLDVLEQFLNYHGHIYLRLDGSTRVEQRQALMERFNADRRIFCFILSTRSGGVGVNLTGADTVVFYDSDWNPTMDAQAQDRCHRIGQTRDVHIYRLISERTVEENILKKANQKRMLGDMAIEGGNFTTAFFKEQTIRELFDMTEGEKREAAAELSVPHSEEEEAVNKQSTTILEQALCRAEDEEDIVAASQAKAEQVAELAEFNENIPLDDGGEQEEVEELSKAEQEIAALVEQLTPIERYAMNFLEASLEDVCKEELKQAEEQVEAARKGLDQAKEEGLRLHTSDDEDGDFLSPPASVEPTQPTPARRGRKPKDKERIVTSTRTSGRLRGASPETEPEPTTPREVPEKPRFGLRGGRGAARDISSASTTPPNVDQCKTPSTARQQDSSRSSKASSPARDHQKTRTPQSRPQPSPVPSPPTTSPPGGKQPSEMESRNSKAGREEEGETVNERRVSESSLESSCAVDHQAKEDEGKDQNAMSPPCTSSRSPRKRQSADGEVLKGLVDDSPSAKVLRKLPGRLVTVVEEKEPRRRRRRGSGTGGGGSSEETTTEDGAGFSDEPNKDSTSPSPDSKTKGTVGKSPQDQDSTPSPSQHLLPVRGYPPYSPPHLSPDMPVLRNLPVRRRLETESRMAAQLGEQLHLGRGKGGNQPKKVDALPGKDPTSSLAESGVNSVGTPLKRKRGRPPKTPPRLSEPDNTIMIPSPPTSPTEDGNPPLSPKRKRGRPRKDSTTVPDTVGEGQNFKKETTTTDMSTASKADASTELPEPVSLIAAVASVGLVSHSAGAEETDPELSTASPNSAQALEMRTDQAFVPVSALIQTPCTPASQVTSPSPTAIQVTSSAADTPSTQMSFPTLSTPATGRVSGNATASPPLVTTVSTPPVLKQTTAISITSEGPVEQNPLLSTTTPDVTKTTAVFTPAATTQPVVSPTLKAAPTVLAKETTPAVTTVVKAVTTPIAGAVKDPVETSALPPTSTPVTSTPPDTQGCYTSTSQVTASLTSSSFPTTQITQTTPAETVHTCPLHVADVNMTPVQTAQASPSVSANVAPPVADSVVTLTPVEAAAGTTASNLPTHVSTDLTKAPKKLVSPTATTIKVAEQVTALTSAAQSSVCTASTATESCPSVTATTPAKTVTIPFPQEKINVTKPAAAATAAPPKEHKPPTTTTTAENTAKIPQLASTSIPSESAPLTTVTTTLSACSSTATTAISTQLSFSTASAVPTGANASPQVTTSQTSTDISMEVKNVASEGISPEVTTQIEASPQGPPTACSGVLSEKPMQEPLISDQAIDMEVDTVAEARLSKKGEKTQDGYESQPKRKKVESSSETKDHEMEGKSAAGEANAPQKDELAEQTNEDQESPPLKRPLSRQSSQESTRSSSPSSGCSTSTLTRHAHHKRTYENRHPAKRMRVDVASESGKEDLKDHGEGRTEEGSDDLTTARRRSRSSSSSSDSDSGGSRKERRLTRSGKRRIQDQEKTKGNNQQGKKAVLGSDRNTSNNANASTGGESGSDTSSVRITRKSAGSQPSQDGKSQTNSTPPLPPEPEVLGKRCSALNAAAKLLAMKGRVDTPGHTTRRESGVKANVTAPVTPSDKNQKPKSKSVPASPQNNSVSLTNNKSSCSKPSTPNQTNRPASRSTRQCPGSLVPPLEGEYKRSKPEEKDRGSRKSSQAKEGEVQSLSRGHSACSSMSSDGEGEGGGRSSRSRSSSNSSQRTHSISSQNTEHRESHSRATSSGSERERDRSSERGKGDKKEKQGQHRESRRDGRRSQRLSQEVAGSTEGTPDRVLRSVAALAAVQARSPAASTRSSANQNRNKT